MNKTLVSNWKKNKKEKVYRFGQQLKNMTSVLETQKIDQFSWNTDKVIKSTKFQTHKRKLLRFQYLQQNIWEMTMLFVINKWFGTANLGWWVV